MKFGKEAAFVHLVMGKLMVFVVNVLLILKSPQIKNPASASKIITGTV
jgi:hypothetical protein